MTEPERTRVLILLLGLALGEPLGGAERFGIELATRLDQARFEPIVCAFWRHNSPAERHWLAHLQAYGIETFFAADAGPGHYLARYQAGVQAIRDRFRGQQVDVIQSHFQMGSLAALLLRRPLAARACVRRAAAAREWGDGVAAAIGRLVFTDWVFPLAFDAEVAISQTLANRLDRRPAAFLRRRRAVRIPTGVPLERFHPAAPAEARTARQTLGLPADALVVGNVGRLRGEKGHRVLLQAAVRVCAARPDVRFVIIGDGELREALQQQAVGLGLAEAVRFTGARTDVNQLYHAMYLFVLPSLWEALGTAILESMASGVPVVATDLPGPRELVTPGRTGWLARSNDPADLAERLLEALADPAARAARAAEALRAVVPRFSIAKIARAYEQLYDQLTGRTAT